MIICFREKDREVIEAYGITIIEAKRILYKTIKMLTQLSDIFKKISGEQIAEILSRNDEANDISECINARDGSSQ